MRKLACLAVFLSAAFGAEMRLHDSAQLMDWDRAVEYCRALDAYVPPLNAMEAAFKDAYLSARGQSPYQKDIYWTSDQTDIEGAYAYDFASGLHLVDHKSNRYRVMCIQSDAY
ncbi:MAG: hypothetical protein LBC09_03390 [Helicobacteraceae bacterium]|jgi:soluble lytic murein transglycosylase-like protein|nr:hypothetical protein [Helicobacteraceae bacterium]